MLVFAWQGYRAFRVAGKEDRALLFGAMGWGSVLALCAVQAFEPKRAAKGVDEKAQ